MTADASHAVFPSDETLAAFIDGKLDKETRKRVVEHMTICAECREVAIVANAVGESSIVRVTSIASYRRWFAAVAAVAAAAVLVAFFLHPIDSAYKRYAFEHRTGLAAVEAAANERQFRPIDGRIAGFDYKPLQPVMRGSEDQTADLTLEAAAGQVAVRAEKARSIENLHALGVAQLLLRKTVATDTLEEALLKQTGDSSAAAAVSHCDDVRLLTDLSAAYHFRAGQERDAQFALAAFNAAQRAWSLQRTPETAWNRAVAAEGVNLTAIAREAWGDYLRLDSSSGWSKEAAERLARLQQAEEEHDWRSERPRFEAAAEAGDADAIKRFVDAYGPDVRLLFEDEWLPALAAGKHPRGTANAATVASAFATRFGDRSLTESLTALMSQPSLAAAVVEYGLGRDAYLHGRNNEALAHFRHSAAGLAPHEVPLGARAAVFVATIAFYNRDFDAAMNMAESARTLAEKMQCPSIAAQSLWIEALVTGSRRSFARANAILLQALSLFTSLEDRASQAALEMIVAGNFRLAADDSAAWDHLDAALALRSRVSRQRGYILVSDVAKTFDRLRATSAVSSVLEYAVALAQSHRDAAEITDALLARAEFNQRRGDASDAAVDVRAAVKEFSAVGDAVTRVRLGPYVDLMVGKVLAVQSPRESLAALDRALPLLRGAGSREKLTEALYSRSIALQRLGDRAAAMASLRETFDEFDRQRHLINEDETRVALADECRPAGDALVSMFIEDGRAADALVWSERTKARVLLDAIRHPQLTALDVRSADDLLRSARRDATYVEYHILPDRFAIWTVTQRGTSLVTINVRENDLDARVRALCGALYRGDYRDADAAGGALYELLIRPVRGSILTNRIVFIPDKSLQRLPWAFLREPASGRRLGADFTCSVAPAISWCNARRGAPDRVNADAQLLFVGGGSGQSHEALPEAIADSRAITAMFRRPIVLDGSVSPNDFYRMAPQADVLAFAGHAEADEHRANHSSLFIGDREEAVTASDIASLELNRVRLVTLAACSTARGRISSDGALSVSRAFLLAGVPIVISANAPIEDRLASALSREFFRRLLSGQDPALALANSERTVCTAGEQSTPQCWSAFQAIGTDV